MVSVPFLHLPLSVAILLPFEASPFSPVSWHPTPTRTLIPGSPYPKARLITALPTSFSSPLARTLNDTLESEEATSASSPFTWNNTSAMRQLQELQAAEAEAESTARTEERIRLKRELGHAAITSFHPEATPQTSSQLVRAPRSAEDIMKDLEQISPLPILRPAMHHSLDAHWSFVFTGVPTIGMRLITLLSRISQSLPFEILDFRDVALCVTDGQSKAKAVVEVQVCGAWEVLLEVCTSLRRPSEEDLEGAYREFRGEAGTLLLEHFQGVRLNGVDIPTPKHWHTTRTLEITYMDKDIMIARTSGGEPHLLLRNSPLCYSPEDMIQHVNDDDTTIMEEEIEECDLDGGGSKWTEFFSEAIEIYGERITRCLVDRDFGREEYYQKKEERTNVSNERRTGNDSEWWKALGGVNLGSQWGIGDD